MRCGAAVQSLCMVAWLGMQAQLETLKRMMAEMGMHDVRPEASQSASGV